MVIKSRQTRSQGGPKYNPFAGATIYFYPKDRNIMNPRVFILKPNWRDGTASALDGRIKVKMNEANQPIVTVNGKRTERFTIRYAGRSRKRLFGSY